MGAVLKWGYISIGRTKLGWVIGLGVVVLVGLLGLLEIYLVKFSSVVDSVSSDEFAVGVMLPMLVVVDLTNVNGVALKLVL